MQKIIYNYLEFVGERLSKKTYTMYALAMRDFFQVVGGTDTPLTKETYVKFLRRTTTMNPSTQALYRSAIKGLYLFAADDDPGVETAFFEQTNKRLALKPGKRLILFNREGIEKILTYCNTIRNDLAELRDRAFILLQADSGLRVSEACALRIGYVDLLECQAVVIGKGNKQAIVKFSNRARDALSDYLQAREYTSKAAPLFIRHTKKAADHIQQVKAGDMWHAIKRRAIEAGVDPATIRVHDFRHYFVTVVLASSGNLKLAQELARHERIETTGRYAHLVDNSSKAYDEIFNKH
jgi:integrase/recombinase XerC